MFKKTILSAVALIALTATVQAEDQTQAPEVQGNQGRVISFKELLKDTSKVQYQYSLDSKKCESTVDSLKTKFGKYDKSIVPKGSFKNIETSMKWSWSTLKSINNGDESKIRITTDFDNKSLTLIEDGSRIYFYFNSLQSCIDNLETLKTFSNGEEEEAK